jgi:hypothetical protein
MINHFIHPIRFYTPRHFLRKNVWAKTNGMDKMMEYHSGLIHKLMEKLTGKSNPKSGVKAYL